MYVKVENLKPGMILDHDVFTREGAVLISKETTLNEYLIMKMLMFGLFRVRVKDNWVMNKEFIEFKESYTNSVEKIKKTFESVKYNQTIKLSEFEHMIDGLFNKTQSDSNILSYIKFMEKKDEYTFQHSINVSVTAMLMGKWLKYNNEDIKLLGIAAILHDIGKIMIPDNILTKPEKLNAAEYNIIMRHTKLGYDLLTNSGIDEGTIKNIVLAHHERLNGKGYPYGLTASYISEKTRIVSICDIYDAVTSERCYKPKQCPLKGLRAVFEDSYNGIDPYLSKIFLNNVSLSYRGSNAVLSDGNIGKIIKVPLEDPEKPWLVVNEQFMDLSSCDSSVEVVNIL